MRPVLKEREIRRQIAELSRHAYERGYIGPGDGNISAKVGQDRIAVTPSGLHKGKLSEHDILIVTLSGEKLAGRGKKTSEFMMHELCYRERPDVGAVVHAHPKYATALALAGVSLAQCILSESCITLGAIVTAPYATPTTDEVPNTLRPIVRCTNAIILNRHGALTLGRTLQEAYDRLEIVEHSAHITHAARTIGPVAPLPEPEVKKLQDIARAFGIPQPPETCAICNACPNGRGGPVALGGGPPGTAGDAETEKIVAAVLERLQS
ncbi:MAG TPA: class II aldolase/adducin family protein [Polyangia bacterium]|nr:class II aldolase/adducin family protein [Polyangia bacterium]